MLAVRVTALALAAVLTLGGAAWTGAAAGPAVERPAIHAELCRVAAARSGMELSVR